MIARIARRLAWALIVIWATVSLAFVVNHALPSDPARAIAGPQARPEDLERIRRELGLGRPIHEQYVRFWRRIVHFTAASDHEGSPDHHAQALAAAHATCAIAGFVHVDLGKSYQQRRPVVTILGERLPRTVWLALAATLVQLLLGVAGGVLAASRRKTWIDTSTISLSLVGTSAPTFVIGLLLQYLFAFRLGVLPLDGWGETTREHLLSTILPALTLGIFGAAYYTRVVRDEMLGQLTQDYIRTARAKGLSRTAVVVRHALRNALLPVVTILGLDLGALIGGAIVTESIFRWPGIGSLSVTATLDRDAPLLMGCVIVTSVSVVFSTVAADFAYLLLDPRIRTKR